MGRCGYRVQAPKPQALKPRRCHSDGSRESQKRSARNAPATRPKSLPLHQNRMRPHAHPRHRATRNRLAPHPERGQTPPESSAQGSADGKFSARQTVRKWSARYAASGRKPAQTHRSAQSLTMARASHWKNPQKSPMRQMKTPPSRVPAHSQARAPQSTAANLREQDPMRDRAAMSG